MIGSILDSKPPIGPNKNNTIRYRFLADREEETWNNTFAGIYIFSYLRLRIGVSVSRRKYSSGA